MKIVSGAFVILLAGMLVLAVNQAIATRQAGWFILVGVQVVFFVIMFVQLVMQKER